MNDWLQDLERWIDDVNRQMDAAAEEAARSVEGWLEQTAGDCDRAISEWQRALEQELRDTWNWDTATAQRDWATFLETLWAPLAELADALELDWLEGEIPPESGPTGDDPNRDRAPQPPPADQLWNTLNPKVDPAPNRYGACIGCHNYHGRIYGGQILVCAIHPHGWSGDRCPDWTTPNEPPPTAPD